MDSKLFRKIIADFSRTIFWNNLKPWPAENEKPYPLQVLNVGEQVINDAILLRFNSGELTIPVAVLPKEGDDADVENVTSEADAHFISMLPVYIPALLDLGLRHVIEKPGDRVAMFGYYAVFSPYESHDGNVGWTVQRIEPGDEDALGEIVAEFVERADAEAFAKSKFEGEEVAI